MTYIPAQELKQTAFSETLVGERLIVINIKPTWGISELRDDTTTTGTGASVSETNGEIRFQTGTSTDSVAKVSTKQRGQYRAGMTGECGIGIRIPTAPVSTQDSMWGYFDDNNGFGFGMDSTGVYAFYRTGGATTKIHQSDWNVDKLDGSGPSSATLNVTDGNIYQIEFVWYGYGTIRYHISVLKDGIRNRIEAHRLNVPGSISIVDANQPISVTATNGESSTSNFDIYLAGRQFSLFGGEIQIQTRPVSEIISKFTITAAQDVWQPLISIRRKATHGPSDRPNSVAVLWTGCQMLSDNPVEYKVTAGCVTSGTPATWSTPTEWTSAESAVETKVQTGSLTASSIGFPVARGILGTSGNRTSSLATSNASIPLGATLEHVLWVRRTTSSATIISAVMEWEEQW